MTAVGASNKRRVTVKIRKKVKFNFILKKTLKDIDLLRNPLKFKESSIQGLIRFLKRLLVRIRIRLQNSTDCHPYFLKYVL